MKQKLWANWCVSILLILMGGLNLLRSQTIVAADTLQLQRIVGTHRATCIFFFVEDCPVSMRDFAVLKQIAAQQRNEEVAFIAVYLGDQKQRLQVIADSIGLKCYYCADSQHVLVAKANARVTPTYMLFDQGGRLRYQGAIDNYAFGFAKHRKRVSAHYLADALVAVLAGQEVKIASTKAFGCIIER
jgi:hypothetical protein